MSGLSKTMPNAFFVKCLKLKVGTKLKRLWCIKCVSIVHCVLDARDHVLQCKDGTPQGQTLPTFHKNAYCHLGLHYYCRTNKLLDYIFYDAGTVYKCEHTFYTHVATSRLCRAAHTMHGSAGVLCSNFTRTLSQGMPCTFL